jgi:acyl-CoA synthetase (NDP forming)
MIASATPAGYKAAMTALLSDPSVDTVVPIFVPPFGIRQQDVAEAIGGAAATRPDKPVLAVLMGREGLPHGRAELHEAGIPAYIFPESAARAVATLNRQMEWAARPAASPDRLTDVDRIAARAILDGAKRDRREHLTQIESLDLLRAYGIPVAEAKLATTATECARIATQLGYPVVMKLVSPDVVHKTDVGGVRVGVSSEAEARAAFDEILASVVSAVPNVHIGGVLVQRMVRSGRETIIGLVRDPSFGPMLMFGLGGIFVEAIGDVVFRIAPLDSTQALSMVTDIRGAKLLGGLRGATPSDREAIATAIRRVGQLAVDCPEILELDVNPMLALADGAMALDARVRVKGVG